MGACTEPGNFAIVTEYLPNGDVHGLVHSAGKNNPIPLLKILVMARDVAQGMNWLHLSIPPIIHRDLKPTNLLVDENMNVKICDFGLSAWQLNKTLQDQGVAPGTPLWMSPEVLRGQPLSEKADVYSFGIVFWEMLTAQEPFENHEDYDRFVEAVCEDGERPEIPESLHPLLQSLLKDCWHETQKMRPSFTEIIQRLDEAIVDTTILDKGGVDIWKNKLFDKKEGVVGLSVGWNKFSVTFYQLIGEKLNRERNDIGYNTLEMLLVDEKKKEVTLEKFGLFSKWFHPFDKTLMQRIVEVSTMPWFHGDLQRKECENILASYKKGYYLVRLSTTEPVQESPFTLSRSIGKGEVKHHRIYRSEDGFYVSVKDKKNKTVKIDSKGPIANLLKSKKLQKELGLVCHCPGSKFGHKVQDDNPYE